MLYTVARPSLLVSSNSVAVSLKLFYFSRLLLYGHEIAHYSTTVYTGDKGCEKPVILSPAIVGKVEKDFCMRSHLSCLEDRFSI